jgi:hypothetical protein
VRTSARLPRLTAKKGALRTMTHAREMLASSPAPIPGVDVTLLADAALAAFDCAQTCTACANACLGEPQVQDLVRCIRLNLHCADLCDTTGRLISRQENPELARAILQTCALACRLCADECERHAAMGMQHCRVCAEACRHCEQACQRLLTALPA